MKKKYDYRDAFLFPWPTRRNFLEETHLSNQIEEWCQNNLNGYFTAANEGVYVYEEEDFVAIKIRWAE